MFEQSKFSLNFANQLSPGRVIFARLAGFSQPFAGVVFDKPLLPKLHCPVPMVFPLEPVLEFVLEFALEFVLRIVLEFVLEFVLECALEFALESVLEFVLKFVLEFVMDLFTRVSLVSFTRE